MDKGFENSLLAAVFNLRGKASTKNRKNFTYKFYSLYTQNVLVYIPVRDTEAGFQPLLVNDYGNQYAPFFTSKEEARAFNGRLLEIGARDLIDVVLDDNRITGIVINPDSTEFYMNKGFILSSIQGFETDYNGKEDRKKAIGIIGIVIILCVLLLAMCTEHTHDWKAATCLSPRTCVDCGATEGEPIEHRWIDATCEKPKRCTYCGTTEGETLAHSWVEATCEKPKHCSVCEVTEGTAAEHNWRAGNATTPRVCTNCEKMEPLTLPQNGQVFKGASLYRYGKLTINSSTTEACYIKLKNSAGNDVFSFFVRAGESVTMSVPEGYYYVYFSYGKDWYGTEYIFGPDTSYSKDDELLDFENYSWTYTLYPTFNGNFTETPIDAEEFK